MASSVAEIERELAELRDEATSAAASGPTQRTSVMTHLAWVPEDWEEAAERTLAGLAERHPSRTILLLPRPDDEDSLELDGSVQTFPAGDRVVCAEVVRARLGGERARHPASVVVPLLVADLPVFLRWRGLPEFDEVFDELIGTVDRLIVDSTEWPSDTLSQGYAELSLRFDRTIVSDIAWERTERWRRELAAAWPFEAREVSVKATYAQALLLKGWLQSRLGHEVRLEHEPSDILLGVYVDGKPIDAPPGEPPPPSELLSDQLERFTRDPVYEAAVRAAAR
jgi:Glucose-6-phosphate dehydrogenase subunit N-terminal domain/Glucose-6-phosphate dehydrogenase subunit C-terminal domain